jgi:TonB dependent receptor
MAHAGDTWKVTPKLSLQLGIRWEMHRPTSEKHDVFSFLDPLGQNPGAAGRPGRLTFAGTRWGSASYGKRHPEETFTTGFAPRLGLAYSLTPKMVVRTGYGIFYDAGQYPGVRGGIALDGFNLNQTFSSSQGGLVPAFILSDGFPQDFQRPPFIDPSFLNGRGGPLYRPFEGNRLPYAQQWNLNVEREFGEGFYVSTAYVGSKGTRLMSRVAPLNALDPQLLATLGNGLYDEFQPDQGVLDGVSLPYPGWAEQMTECAPSVAQALLPYPQYCGGLTGVNENAGNSTFHSFQVKAEKRFSGGLWLLGSYTLAKLITDSDNVQPDATSGSTIGLFSPFERRRAKSLTAEDVPQTLSLSFMYDLPFGRGKRWLSNGGVLDKVVGGWRISSIFRINSGTPFLFRSGNCNVPDQFRASCIPAILPGANPFAQSKDGFDPNRSLFDIAAFEPTDSFNFYYGQGARVSNVRGFGYHNHDFALFKNFQITEGINFQVRGEFFNVWNWHIFRGFDTDVANPTFGMWDGTVTAPRNIQVGARVTF